MQSGPTFWGKGGSPHIHKDKLQQRRSKLLVSSHELCAFHQVQSRWSKTQSVCRGKIKLVVFSRYVSASGTSSGCFPPKDVTLNSPMSYHTFVLNTIPSVISVQLWNSHSKLPKYGFSPANGSHAFAKVSFLSGFYLWCECSCDGAGNSLLMSLLYTVLITCLHILWEISCSSDYAREGTVRKAHQRGQPY